MGAAPKTLGTMIGERRPPQLAAPVEYGRVLPLPAGLSDMATSAATGGLYPKPIPLDQQGFAAHQGYNGMGLRTGLSVQPSGPMYGQEQRTDLGKPLPWGLRDIQNFAPRMPAEEAARGTDGILGTVGGSTLIRRPNTTTDPERALGTGMSLMGERAAADYGNMVSEGRMTPEEALTTVKASALKNQYNPQTKSGQQFAARVEREKAKNAVAAQRKSDLKSWAMATKRGIPLDEGVAKRLGGGESAGGKGPYNLSTNELSVLHDPDPAKQAAHKAATGVAPMTSPHGDVVNAITNQFPSLSGGKSKEQMIKTIRAWTMGPQGQKAPKQTREWIDGWLKHQESGSKKPYHSPPKEGSWTDIFSNGLGALLPGGAMLGRGAGGSGGGWGWTGIPGYRP